MENTEHTNQATNYHTPVLLHTTIQHLNIKPDGIYVDMTFGGGGHSRAILEQLGEHGKLYAFDQDEDALKNALKDSRFTLIHGNFRHCKRFLRFYGIDKIDGVLADLGVSSYQFDTAEKGFSYRFNAPLDMRMNQQGEKTAAQILSTYSEQDLKWIFQEYGEVRNASTLAKTIVQRREITPIQTIDDFNALLEPLSFGNFYKYAAPIYQALRIEVNEELEALKEMLQDVVEFITPNGRVAVITFHSLEDRLVKNYFKQGVFEGEAEKDFFGKTNWNYKVITKKPVEATSEEIALNPRSRSAKLRVIERIEK